MNQEGNMTVKRMEYSITIESTRTFPRATRRNTQTRGKSVIKGAWIINIWNSIFDIRKIRCLEFKQCKGFTWHKDKHPQQKLSKACSLFSSYSYKGDGNSVSGLRECSGELKTRSKGIGGGMGGCLDGWTGWWVETRVPKTSSAWWHCRLEIFCGKFLCEFTQLTMK